MIKWFLRRWIDKFERMWGYDASYLRDVLDADPRALLAFSKVSPSPPIVQQELSALFPRIVGRARSSQSTWPNVPESIRQFWCCAALASAAWSRWRSP